MVYIIRIIIVIFFSVIILACSNNGCVSETNTQIRKSYINKSNSYELIVYGSFTNNNIATINHAASKYTMEINSIAIRLMPNDNEILYPIYGRYKKLNVIFDLSKSWSPNGNYLLLPKGITEGFTVFYTNDLPNGISSGNGKYSIVITDITGIALWHEFDGWKDCTTINFRAGLSGIYSRFEWDVAKNIVRPLNYKSGRYILIKTIRFNNNDNKKIVIEKYSIPW